MNVSLTSGLGLLYTNTFNVSHKNGFVNYDFQQLTLILGFCTLKNGNNGLIPKSYCLIESYRNARIAIFEFVDKLDFTYFV